MNSEENNIFNSLSQLFWFVLKNKKGLFCLTITTSTCGVLFWILTTTSLKYLIDSFVHISSFYYLLLYFFLHIGCTSAIHFCFYITRYCYAFLGPQVEQDVRMLTFKCVQTISINYFKKKGDGFIENFIDCLAEGIESTLWICVNSLIPGFFLIIYGVIRFFFIHPICGIIYCLLLVSYIFIAYLMLKKSSYFFSQQTLVSHQRTHLILDAFKNIITLKIFRLHKTYYDKVYQLHNKETQFSKQYRLVTVNFEVAQCLFSIITLFMMFIYIFLGIRNHSITIGTAVEIFGIVSVLSHSIFEQTNDAIELIQYYSQSNLSIKLINAAEKEYKLGNDICDTKGDIEFQNFNFFYGNKQIIKDLSCIIPYGKKVVIMGPSGLGKSTLLKSIVQLLAVEKQSIFINNHDIKTLNHHKWLDKISYLTQHDTILDGNVYENIALNNDFSNLQAVKEAAQLAEIHKVIDDFPNKYETNIGTNGISLSGGQIKRLCLARAFLNIENKDFILCDEPTNSLDLFTAKHIIKIINKVSANKTTLIVDHSMHAIEISDLIIFIKDSDTILFGTHEKLLNIDSVYKSSFSLKYDKIFYGL